MHSFVNTSFSLKITNCSLTHTNIITLHMNFALKTFECVIAICWLHWISIKWIITNLSWLENLRYFVDYKASSHLQWKYQTPTNLAILSNIACNGWIHIEILAQKTLWHVVETSVLMSKVCLWMDCTPLQYVFSFLIVLLSTNITIWFLSIMNSKVNNVSLI